MTRVLLLATGHGLAPPVLQALRDAGHEVVGLATLGPVTRPPGRVLLAPDVVAAAGSTPVHTVTRTTDPRPLLEATRPDVVVVACFPWRLSAAWWDERPVFNVHPSLLPRYRGPIPLFWQYRDGDERTGVTVHRVDAGLDTGPIVAQQAVPLPDDVDMTGAERRLGQEAGRLLVDVLSGGATALPQAHGTAQGWPCEDDLALSFDWSARRAYRFVRLAGGAFPLRAGRLCLRSARSWSAEVPGALRFADGWLHLGPGDAHQGSSSTLPVV